MSGNVKKFNKDKGYESINRNMLQDIEKLSLEAIGLLAHLTSYPETWRIYKTELYTRFAKSKRKKVEKAWKELVEEKYIIQLRKRVGQKYEYIYYHQQHVFTDEEIKIIASQEQAEIWDGKMTNDKVSGSNSTQEPQYNNISSTVPNEQSKMNSSESTDNKFTREKINHKDKNLDNKDTEDTNQLEIENQFSNDLTEEQRLKEKEMYMLNAYYANQERVPERIANMLKVFSASAEQATEYYKIILLAKRNAEINTDYIIWLENEPIIEHEIINSFSRAVRKIEKESNIQNPKGYIYKAIYDYLIKEIGNRQKVNMIINGEESNYPSLAGFLEG